jgi:hypothetical protein
MASLAVGASRPLNSYLADWIDRLLETDPRETHLYPSEAWKAFREIAFRAASRKWTVYLVGGALRDMVLSGGTKEPRDLDFVFCHVHLDEIYAMFRDLPIARRTSLGGLRLSLHSIPVDVWSLNDTYAVRSKSEVTIQDVPKHAFLNVEAIAVEISPTTREHRRVVDCGFTQAVLDQTLEVNYEPNPLPEVCLIKAFRIAIKWKMLLGTSLLKYAQKRSWDPDRLLEAQKNHFGDALLDRLTIQRSLSVISNWHSKEGKVDLASQLISSKEFRT